MVKLFLTLLLTFPSVSFSASWELTVIYPDREQKKFVPTADVFKVNMGAGTTWECFISPEKNIEGGEGGVQRDISCGTLKSKDVANASTRIACVPKINLNVGALFLSSKDKDFTLMLSCDPTS